jgi:hypothetical protein
MTTAARAAFVVTTSTTDRATPKRGDRTSFHGAPTGRFVGERNGVRWTAYKEADFAPMCAAFDAPAVRAPDRRLEDAVAQLGGEDARLALYAERLLRRAARNQPSWTFDETWVAYVTTLHGRFGWERHAPTAAALLAALKVSVVPVPPATFGVDPDREPEEGNYEATAAIDGEGRTTLLVRDDIEGEYVAFMEVFGVGIGMLADLAPELRGRTLSRRSLASLAHTLDSLGRMAFIPTRIAREAMLDCDALAAAKKLAKRIDLPLSEIENRLCEMRQEHLLFRLNDFHVNACVALHSTLVRLVELPYVAESQHGVTMSDHAPEGAMLEEGCSLEVAHHEVT